MRLDQPDPVLLALSLARPPRGAATPSDGGEHSYDRYLAIFVGGMSGISESITSFFSPIWAVGILFLTFCFAATPLFRGANAVPQVGQRAVTIDGLRGYLAMGVLIHHASLYRDWIVSKVWHAPDSNLYSALGPVGVGMFFMITAYLFWGRILKGNTDWLGLYVGRVFRIGPLYWVAISFVIVISFVLTGGGARGGCNPLAGAWDARCSRD